MAAIRVKVLRAEQQPDGSRGIEVKIPEHQLL
jgi:hypothetical protein